MPWKSTRDPYKIWLSEIILQQTRVAQGTPYYLKFIKRYPTVFDLASASEDQILKDWQGLGYNTRARNLLAAARQVVHDHNGIFPGTFEGLLRLKGVGVYTAAAIASFAFGASVPVVDSNVYRVVSRFCGIEEPLGSAALDSKVRTFLNSSIAGTDPAAFNQAIMDFGALHCTAFNPVCAECPLSFSCVAFNSQRVEVLPVRKPRKPRRRRYFHYGVLTDQAGLVLQKRKGQDIWRGLYDFPLVETSDPSVKTKIIRAFLQRQTGLSITSKVELARDTQVLTHQQVHCTFYRFVTGKINPQHLEENYCFVEYQNLSTFAVPKVVDCYLRANSILL